MSHDSLDGRSIRSPRGTWSWDDEPATRSVGGAFAGLRLAVVSDEPRCGPALMAALTQAGAIVSLFEPRKLHARRVSAMAPHAVLVIRCAVLGGSEVGGGLKNAPELAGVPVIERHPIEIWSMDDDSPDMVALYEQVLPVMTAPSERPAKWGGRVELEDITTDEHDFEGEQTKPHTRRATPSKRGATSTELPAFAQIDCEEETRLVDLSTLRGGLVPDEVRRELALPRQRGSRSRAPEGADSLEPTRRVVRAQIEERPKKSTAHRVFPAPRPPATPAMEPPESPAPPSRRPAPEGPRSRPTRRATIPPPPVADGPGVAAAKTPLPEHDPLPPADGSVGEVRVGLVLGVLVLIIAVCLGAWLSHPHWLGGPEGSTPRGLQVDPASTRR